MSVKKYQLENYRKFLLNRVTASSHIIDYIENCLATEDETAPHSFSKIMIHSWSGNDTSLFNTLTEYFSCSFIPVNYITQGEITTFYTSSLNLVLKIIKLDFMFPHQRNMFNVDILFNDKSSVDCFDNHVTIEDIVAGVVSCRLSEKFELNLSNFCSDPEFIQKKIIFYKLSLLTHFKILMLRMGRDTKTLNLSNNNLSQIPVEILNFFIKGDLIAINLSNNNIPSLLELHRISSKIEKLWVEGNPLCEDLDAGSYVKNLLMKFPRLRELDGITLNEHGIILPFHKNYLDVSDKRTKMLVEKFLTLYYAHYDSPQRKSIDMFYDPNVKLTISTSFTEAQEQSLQYYAQLSRNILHPTPALRKQFAANGRVFSTRASVVRVLATLPETLHDPTTFTVDLLKHDKKSLILIVDGVYKEVNRYKFPKEPFRFFRFRRTFVFHVHMRSSSTAEYFIANEMFHVALASKEDIDISFKDSARSTNPLALKNPEPEDMEAICNVFSHLTQLKRPEAETRLKNHSWDITKSLRDFLKDMKSGKISSESFMNDDDFSDSSSLIEDQLD